MTTSSVAFSRLSPAVPTRVFDSYWYLAAERQEIFFRRLGREPQESWTTDPILKKYKFTNSYRASDRASQYLIRNVIYRGVQEPQEIFFRIILFKLFNRIETWALLERELGEVTYSDYSFDRYDHILNKALSRGSRIYSGAYIMPSGNRIFGYRRKHRNHLKLLERMMSDEAGLRIFNCKSMRQAFETLKSYPLIGDFLAYQYMTDLNYSTLTDFSETEFVVPGPGASEGIRKCFTSLGGLSEANMIRHVMESQEKEFAERGFHFQTLWGRRLHLIDCQNLFCEVNKYARVAHPEFVIDKGRTRIKQRYKYTESEIDYWYPPKWNINQAIEERAATKRRLRRNK